MISIAERVKYQHPDVKVMKLVDILNNKYNVRLSFKDIYLEETPENISRIISEKLLTVSKDKCISDIIKI